MAAATAAPELIAFDSKKQSSYAKAVKKIKKDIVSEAERKTEGAGYRRGIILISHLPHGFYEQELRGFFSQFGRVTRVRVARSTKTGRPKGYAFVEFEFEEVAQIAAESMNNYLMYERLIKCQVLTGKIKAGKLFANGFGADNYPTALRRKALKKKLAEPVEQSEEEQKKIIELKMEAVERRNKKLAELGIDYQFKLKVPSTPGAEATATSINNNKAAKKAKSPKNNSPAQMKSSPSPQVPPTPKTPTEIKVKKEEATSTEQKKQKKTPNKKSPATPAQLKFSPSPKTKGSPTPTKKKIHLGIQEEDEGEVPLIDNSKAKKTPNKKTPAPAQLKFSPKLLRSSTKVKNAVEVPTPASATVTPKAKFQQHRKSLNVPPKTPKGTPAAAVVKPKTASTNSTPVPIQVKAKRMSCTVPSGVSKPPGPASEKKEKPPKFSPKLLRSRTRESGVEPVATPLPKRRKSMMV